MCTLRLALNRSQVSHLPWRSTAFRLNLWFHRPCLAKGLNLGQLVIFQSNKIPTLKWGEKKSLALTALWLFSSIFPPCALMARHIVSWSISYQGRTPQRVPEKDVLSSVRFAQQLFPSFLTQQTEDGGSHHHYSLIQEEGQIPCV